MGYLRSVLIDTGTFSRQGCRNLGAPGIIAPTFLLGVRGGKHRLGSLRVEEQGGRDWVTCCSWKTRSSF